jgi:hypothetical protein
MGLNTDKNTKARSTNLQESPQDEATRLAEDIVKRNVVWDVEYSNKDTSSGSSPSNGLLGQRMQDGSIVPLGRLVTGKPVAQIEHVDQIVVQQVHH